MKRVVLGAVLLLVVLLAAVGLYLDRILGSAIERGASYALGVETRVGFARMRPLSGSFVLSGLRVANPPGFDESHFIALDGARLALRLSSLREPVVVVPTFQLTGVDLALEMEGRETNYGAILRNLQRFESKGEPARDAPEEEGGGKRFVVHQLLISDVRAHVEWSRTASDQTALEVAIPRIELRDVGARGARGVALSELTDIIVKALLTAVAREGGSLPGAMLGQLQSGLGSVARVPGLAIPGTGLSEVSGRAAESAGDAVGSLGGALDETARKALGGLLGGRREPSE